MHTKFILSLFEATIKPIITIIPHTQYFYILLIKCKFCCVYAYQSCIFSSRY